MVIEPRAASTQLRELTYWLPATSCALIWTFWATSRASMAVFATTTGNEVLCGVAGLAAIVSEMDADLITNDYNLQKIAQLHRLTVINVNEIANALRPTVYIGESFPLVIVREGKEVGQGVGYLEDGTMVVVDDAGHLLSQEISVVVSSILQTSSGRLVFARPRDEENHRVRA